MSEKQWTPEAMDEWADQFEPAPLVSMSIGGRDCLNTAAMLRHGAASLRRWEALKAEAKEFSDQQQTNQHRQGAAMMAATFYRTMQRMEREPEQADSGPDCTCHSASNSSCAAHRKTYSNAADLPPARREGSDG